MLLRLVSPVRRPGSSNIWFQKRLPADLRDRLVGRAVVLPLGDMCSRPYTIPKSGFRLSLGTADPSEAKVRHGELAAYLEKLFQALRNSRPVSLTRGQAVALSGRAYDAWAYGEGRERSIALEMVRDPHHPRGAHPVRVFDDEGEGEGFAALAARLASLENAGADALEPILGAIVNDQLLREGIPELTAESREVVLEEFRRSITQGAEVRARNAEGDYSPDPRAKRFPEWQSPGALSKAPPVAEAVSLVGLVEGWWVEQAKVGKAHSTYVNYRGVVRRLVAFLGHDDAHRLTAEDLVRFKDHRLANGMSPRTVNDNDLAALRSVLGWAVANRKIADNAATGVTIKGVRKVKRRSLSEAEALAILRLALKADEGAGAERRETTLAKRWAPWLMAYTGARVGEIGQLRKQDLVWTPGEGDDAGHWSIIITPEAGTVKGGRERQVPLHPHIVDMGFTKVVKTAPAGHLFLRTNPDTGDALGPLQGVKNRLAEVARGVVPDKSVSPNHGWRHLFITRCRRHGVSDELRRMITGHSGEGVDERDYGEPAGLYREICKLPRIIVGSDA